MVWPRVGSAGQVRALSQRYPIVKWSLINELSGSCFLEYFSKLNSTVVGAVMYSTNKFTYHYYDVRTLPQLEA